jgi:tetratricopeptide (TPR) repeat protein
MTYALTLGIFVLSGVAAVGFQVRGAEAQPSSLNTNLPQSIASALNACQRVNATRAEARVAACTEAMNYGALPKRDLAVARRNRAEAYMATGDETHATADFEESVRLYNVVIDPRQPVPETVYQRGLSLAAIGKADSAIEDYNKALELDPTHIGALVQRGIVLSQRRGEYGRAIADFTNALQLDANDVEALTGRGDAFSRIGSSQLAFADLDRAVSLSPDNPRALVIRGLARGRGGDTRQALEDYNNALKLDYRDVDALTNRAAIYSMNGDQRKAIVDLDLALTRAPRAAGAFYNRGFARFAQRNYELAIADYTSAIEIDNNMAAAYNNRCLTRVVANIDLPKAVEDCDKALKALPDRVDFRDTRGFVFLKLGKPELAFMEYDAAVKQDATRPLSLYGRSIARLNTGDSAGAQVDRAAALTLDPTVEIQFERYGIQ